MGIERFVYDRLQSAMTTAGFGGVATVEKEEGITVRQISFTSTSAFVGQTGIEILAVAKSKEDAAAMADAIETEIEALPSAKWILKTEVNTIGSAAVDNPPRWLYTTRVSITHRRDVDFADAEENAS